MLKKEKYKPVKLVQPNITTGNSGFLLQNLQQQVQLLYQDFPMKKRFKEQEKHNKSIYLSPDSLLTNAKTKINVSFTFNHHIFSGT